MDNSENEIKKTGLINILWLSVFNKRNIMLLVFLLIAVLVMWLLITYQYLKITEIKSNNDAWTNILDPVITIGTFVIGFLLGIYGLITQWENNLEKRLSICFIYSPKETLADLEEKLKSQKTETIVLELKELESEKIKAENVKLPHQVSIELSLEKIRNQKTQQEDFQLIKTKLKESEDEESRLGNIIDFRKKNSIEKDKTFLLFGCFESFLLNENDIRAFSQQIGAQIIGERNLSILPFVHLEEKMVAKKEFNTNLKNSYYIKHYMFSMYLSDIPKAIVKNNFASILDENYSETPNNKHIDIKIAEINKVEYLTYRGFRKFVEINKIPV